MPTQAIIVISIASGVLALAAIGMAIWHTCRMEWHRHHRPGARA